MKKINILKYFILLKAVCLMLISASGAQAQFAIEITDFMSDIRIEITSLFPDEKWQITGECWSSPDLRVEITDFLPDKRVEITNFGADRRVCITNADRLDTQTLRKLQIGY